MVPMVLVIEPMAALRQIYERYVTSWGFRVRGVDNLEQARAHGCSTRPRLHT